MNPSKVPDGPLPGPQPAASGQSPQQSAPGPLSVPPHSAGDVVHDTPDSAFGFADEDAPLPETPPNEPLSALPPEAPAPPLPAPTAMPQPVPLPAPESLPRPAVPTPAPTTPSPVPQDVMPPQRVPAVPTLTPPEPTPATQPAAANPAAAEPIPVAPRPLASTPVQAAAPANAVTASYSPPVTHLPQEIAERIAETPIQNSSDIVKDSDKGGRLKSILSFLVFTAAIFIAAFLINQFIFQSYYVEGTSMTPTLQNNDRLIISKVEKTWANMLGRPYIPDRGQIVVLDSSIVGLNGQKEQLIKRVIGLPGDHIHIENGVVTITNSQHPSGYNVTKDLGLTYLADTYVDAPLDITVPPGQVFVMGDNRAQNGSYDSRAFGPIDGDKIQGRLWARILPVDKIQLF